MAKETILGRDRTVVLSQSQVLISGEALRRRVAEMGAQISRAYRDRRVVVVGVLKGAVHFLSDLTRCLTIDQRLEFVRVSTYGSTASPERPPRPEVYSDFDITDQDVLVVDDILDRGHTVQAVHQLILSHKPRSVRWAVLLVKDGSIERSGVRPEFVGFEIPDMFVVGYGLDYAERYRNLPDIYIFEQGAPE